MRARIRAKYAIAASILLLPFLCQPALAADGDGGTRSIFSLGAGSRAISLGRAFVSLVDDASAVYWNPAALRNVQTKQIMGMYMPLFGDFSDATYTYFAVVYPTLEAGAFGAAFMRISDNFKTYDIEGSPTGEGEYSESQMIFSYAAERHARYLLGTMAVGASFKIANIQISPYSSTSPGIDIGFRYVPDFARSIALAANIQDVSGPKHKLVNTTDKTYRTVLAGMGYRRVFSNGSALSLMLQVDLPEKADRKFNVGAEYALSRYLAFRLGMNAGDFTFGLGINVSSFGLDYASFSRKGAGSSRPVSFTTHYGKTIYEQKRILAEERALKDQELIRRAFIARVKSHRTRAMEYENRGEIPKALDEWKIVLEYMPGDSEAVDHMEKARMAMIREQEEANQNLEMQAKISTHFSAGLKFYSENDYVRARDAWREVLKLAPDHESAREYLRKTQLKIDELISSHRIRAAEYERLGRLTEAIGEWNNVALLDPANVTAQEEINRLKSKIDAQTKDYKQTARKLRIVNLYNDALQKFNTGDYKDAMTDLRELLRLEPGHDEARKLMTMVKRKLTPLTPEEEEEIRKLYLKGMQYFAKDQYREAIAEWEKILKIDPANESVKRNIEEARERLRKIGGEK